MPLAILSTLSVYAEYYQESRLIQFVSKHWYGRISLVKLALLFQRFSMNTDIGSTSKQEQDSEMRPPVGAVARCLDAGWYSIVEG